MAQSTVRKRLYEEKPFWRLEAADGITCLLEEIPSYFQKVLMYVNEPEDPEFIQGFMDVYRELYLTECNRGEKTRTQTLEEEREVPATKQEMKYMEVPETREEVKTQNLFKAICYLFGESVAMDTAAYELNVDLAKMVNKLIGEDLFSGAGDFRKSDAKPAGFDYLYVPANEIPELMDDLFKKLNSDMKSINSNNWYEIASKFFIKFLDIHPFPNGNGRTARLLLSCVVCKYTLVPVFLFSPLENFNEGYLVCVREASWFHNYELINALIIESCYRILHLFLTTFELI